MEDRYSTASRWLTALAVIIIPLSVIAVVSGAWGLNYQFDTNQWTKYLLFAAWILFTVSVAAGVAGLISPPEEEGAGQPPPASAAEEDAEEGGQSDAPEEDRKRKQAFDVGYALLLTQACAFALGLILYVSYISWMILGLKPYPTMPGL